MDDLVLNQYTKDQLGRYCARPAHGLLLSGSDGVGKATLASMIVAVLLDVDRAKLNDSPQYVRIAPDDKGTISIDAIRKLQQFTRLKAPGTRTIRRAIIIEDAAALTTEAQNALLKMLEEPPEDTVLILTCSDTALLLPTIHSRVQTVSVLAPTKESTIRYFSTKYDATLVTQAYFLSGGMPGLMTVLLDGEQEHPLFQAVARAKQVLTQDKFERMLLVDALAKQKQEARLFCDALSRIAEVSLVQAADANDTVRIKRWHHIVKLAQSAGTDLKQNANTKLCLTQLFLQI